MPVTSDSVRALLNTNPDNIQVFIDEAIPIVERHWKDSDFDSPEEADAFKSSVTRLLALHFHEVASFAINTSSRDSDSSSTSNSTTGDTSTRRIQIGDASQTNFSQGSGSSVTTINRHALGRTNWGQQLMFIDTEGILLGSGIEATKPKPFVRIL